MQQVALQTIIHVDYRVDRKLLIDNCLAIENEIHEHECLSLFQNQTNKFELQKQSKYLHLFLSIEKTNIISY